ncbi:serine hydrolase [Nocardia shimofusensis]|uniref:serine hydrolase n=1 Tax=Nocardia shimofusensis TaxID=228596 RepID=UPI000832554E|nr:serine hydrolase [Nocardia shimofusensis]
MGHRRLLVVALVMGSLLIPGTWAGAETATEVAVPRTTIAVRTDLGHRWGLGAAHAPRGALSLAKLYLVDYALRHGDGSAVDRELGERMIRYSDDVAADRLAGKYPGAIAAVAAEYGLTATGAGGHWSAATTSSADVAEFLHAKARSDPGSPILAWMATAGDRAADGTPQNWGTARLPGVLGTKWGWSDFGTPEVASVSFGPGFTVAAHTYGTPADQTADVLAALPQMLAGLTGIPPDLLRQWGIAAGGA